MSKQINVSGDSPLKDYKTYLEKQKYSKTTIESYVNESEVDSPPS